jgi:hypothetical protein
MLEALRKAAKGRHLFDRVTLHIRELNDVTKIILSRLMSHCAADRTDPPMGRHMLDLN